MSNGKVRTAEENYGKRKHFSEIEEKEKGTSIQHFFSGDSHIDYG